MFSILIPASIARADGPVAMKPVADAAAVCAALTGGDSKVKCTSAAKSTVRDVGNVELYVAKGDVVRYAIVVAKDGKTLMSAPLELMTSDCGMQKCDLLDDHKPALRTLSINGKGVAGALVEQKFHHEHSDDSSGKNKQVVDDRWTATTVIACSATKCLEKTWGGRHNACKVQLKNDGTTVASCETTDSLSVD
jgi:hypothetical protein